MALWFHKEGLPTNTSQIYKWGDITFYFINDTHWDAKFELTLFCGLQSPCEAIPMEMVHDAVFNPNLCRLRRPDSSNFPSQTVQWPYLYSYRSWCRTTVLSTLSFVISSSLVGGLYAHKRDLLIWIRVSFQLLSLNIGETLFGRFLLILRMVAISHILPQYAHRYHNRLKWLQCCLLQSFGWKVWKYYSFCLFVVGYLPLWSQMDHRQ